MSRGNKLGPEPAIRKGALMGQMKWLSSFDDKQKVAWGFYLDPYGGNVLNFLLLRRKTVALMPIDWVAGQTFCDKWFICDATLIVGKRLQGEFKKLSNQKRGN